MGKTSKAGWVILPTVVKHVSIITVLVTHAKKGVREQRTEGLRKELEGHTAEARAVSKGTSLALLHSYSVGWCRCPKSPCKKQNDLHLDGSKQLSLTGLGLTRSYFDVAHREPSFWHWSWRNELPQCRCWIRKQAHLFGAWRARAVTSHPRKGKQRLMCARDWSLPVWVSQHSGSRLGLGETFLKVSAAVRQGRLLNQGMGIFPSRIQAL